MARKSGCSGGMDAMVDAMMEKKYDLSSFLFLSFFDRRTRQWLERESWQTAGENLLLDHSRTFARLISSIVQAQSFLG